MAEPPPLFGDDDENAQKEEEDEDLFKSATETPNEPEPQPEPEKKENGIGDDVDLGDDDDEDLFAGGGTEIKLDSPEEEEPTKPDEDKQPSSPPSLPVTETAPSAPAATKTTKQNTDNDWITEEKTQEEVIEKDEEESGDQFQMEITVTEPKKMGDGMGSYMAYKVNTKTTVPQFRRSETSVYRRFSDFLGLHDKLVDKYMTQGRIVPPAPEKSVIGMTKIKMSKEEAGSQEFVEKRRAALERYLNRTAKHATLRVDSDFREFLEAEGDLPRSTSTSALSGAGVMRLFSKVGDSFGKMTFKMDETDQWFEEKQQQIDALDQQLRKLHSSIEALVQHRKELALNTGQFAKSAAMLGNAEEHTALSRALSQLAEVEEKIDQLHMDQADNDFFVFSELIKDYISLIGAVKEVFAQRVKVFKMWKETEANLTKKREMRAKLELQRKMDKIPAVSAEITDLENKVEKYQEDFESISKVIRKEMVRFEKQRVKDFKSTIIHYLESLMNSQQQVIKYWEAFLPEAKAIA